MNLIELILLIKFYSLKNKMFINNKFLNI